MRQSLTKIILEEFGDRKHESRLSVITDLNEEGRIYVIPHNKEHIEFCTELVGDTRKLKRVIPTHIDYRKSSDNYIIDSIITGESGMEQGYGIRHTPEDLLEAHNNVLRFIYDGEITLMSGFTSRIVNKYLV